MENNFLFLFILTSKGYQILINRLSQTVRPSKRRASKWSNVEGNLNLGLQKRRFISGQLKSVRVAVFLLFYSNSLSAS